MKHPMKFSAAALAFALVAGSPFVAEPVQAQTRATAASALRVTGFDVEQVDRLEPGAELNFTLWGTPGAAVVLQIDGGRRTVRLDETTAGRYQGSYVVARLCDYRLQLYATAAYLRGQPPILSPRDLPRHPFYGYVDELVFSPELRYLQQVSPGLAQPLRSSSVIAQYTAVQRGQGLAILPCFLAAQDPALVPVLAEQVLLQRSFWLVAPPELRRIARIRAAWDYLRRMAELNRAFLMGEAREMRYISR